MKMDNKHRLNTSLDLLQEGLSSYVEKKLQAEYKNKWWEKGIIRALKKAPVYNQLRDGETSETDWKQKTDLSQLFSILLEDENWGTIFTHYFGKNKKYVRDLREIRNKTAHNIGESSWFSNENTTRCLDSIINFLLFIENHNEAEKIRRIKNKDFQNIPYPRNTSFIGRDELIIEIHEKLMQSDVQRKNRIFLTGISGIGKTQIAIEYAYQHMDYYSDGVFWIKSSTDFSSEFVKVAGDFVSNILSEKNLKDSEALKEFSDYLIDNNKALIIIDDLEESGEIDKPIMGVIPSTLSGQMIITSKRTSSKYQQESIEVTGLSSDSAVNLLLTGSTRKRATDDQPQDSSMVQDAEAICAAFGFHPLAISLASAYLEKLPEISLYEYLQRIKREGSYITILEMDTDPLIPISHSESSIQNLFEFQWKALGISSKKSLQIMSLFDDLINVPRSLISSLAGIEDNKNKRTGCPTQFDTVLVELKKFRFIEERLTERTRFSRNYDDPSTVNFYNQEPVRRYTIHPLIQDFISQTERLLSIDDLIRKFIEAIRNPELLNESIILNGIDNKIGEIQCMCKLVKKASTPWIDIKSTLSNYLSLFKQECHNLRNWKMVGFEVITDYPPEWFCPQNLPGFALQQISNRLFLGKNDRDSEIFRYFLKNSHFPALCEQTMIGADSIILGRTFIGHSDQINDMVITRDDQIGISSSEDGTIIEWDIGSGKVINQTLREENFPLFSAVNIENQRVISQYEIWKKWVDNEILWDDLNKKNNQRDDKPENSVNHLAASIDFYGEILIWDTKDGKLITKLELDSCFELDPFSSSLYFSIENQRLIYQGKNGIIFWEIKNWTRKLLQESGEGNYLSSSALDSLHKVFIFGDNTGTLSWIDIETGTVSKIEDAHCDLIPRILFNPENEKIITASLDGYIKEWRWVGEDFIFDRCFSFEHKGISDIGFSPCNKTLIAGHTDGTLSLWDYEKGNQIRVLMGHGKLVTKVIISTQGDRAFSISEDHTIKTWDLNKIVEDSDEALNSSGIRNFFISKISKYGIGISSNIAILYGLETNSEITRIMLEDEEINGVVSSSEDDASAIIYGRNLYRWNFLDEAGLQTIQLNEDIYRTFIYVTSNNHWALSRRINCDHASEGKEHPDDTVEVWNLDLHKIVHSFNVEAHSVRLFFIDESGKIIKANNRSPQYRFELENSLPEIETWIFNGVGLKSSILPRSNHQRHSLISADGKWLLLEKKGGVKEIRDLYHNDLLISLSYGRSDLYAKYLVVTEEHFASIIFSDGSIHLWNLYKGRCMTVLPGSYVSCALTADGSKLVAIDSIGQIHFLECLNCNN